MRTAPSDTLARHWVPERSLLSDAGLVTARDVPGQVAVMASFMGAVDVFRALIPRGRATNQLIGNPPYPAEHNFIDRLVHEQLRKLNILPSDVADDATYLRRVHLDVIGTLPTAAEARAFLADQRSEPRFQLVDALAVFHQAGDLAGGDGAKGGGDGEGHPPVHGEAGPRSIAPPNRGRRPARYPHSQMRAGVSLTRRAGKAHRQSAAGRRCRC